MCELFFPKPGREIFLPRMFQADFLPTALKSVTARYILASACAQMEPDDPDYVRVTHAVYDDVDRKVKCFIFLVATQPLYKSVRPSVGGYVCYAFAFWPSRSDICGLYSLVREF